MSGIAVMIQSACKGRKRRIEWRLHELRVFGDAQTQCLMSRGCLSSTIVVQRQLGQVGLSPDSVSVSQNASVKRCI